jgi:hypothetical protein
VASRLIVDSETLYGIFIIAMILLSIGWTYIVEFVKSLKIFRLPYMYGIVGQLRSDQRDPTTGVWLATIDGKKRAYSYRTIYILRTTRRDAENAFNEDEFIWIEIEPIYD